MKKSVALSAGALLLAASTAFALVEMQLDKLREGTEHRDLYTLAQDSSGNTMLAAGAFGTILTSTDGGATWNQGDHETRLSLLASEIVGDRQILTGQDGLVLVRSAGDEQWTQADSGVEARLLGVGMNEEGLTIAVGSFGTVLRSTDHGGSWEALDLKLPDRVEGGYNPHLYDAHVSQDGSVTLVGEFGLVIRSPDGGDNWKIVRTGTASLFSLEISDNGTGYAVGQSGTILRTGNGGLTWSERDTGIDANLLGVFTAPDGRVVVPGFRYMLVSKDDGESWQRVAAGDVDRGWYISAGGAADNGVIAVGHRGRIVKLSESNS